MSNSILRKDLMERFDASFAEPAFSADNAAGVAVFGCSGDAVFKGRRRHMQPSLKVTVSQLNTYIRSRMEE